MSSELNMEGVDYFIAQAYEALKSIEEKKQKKLVEKEMKRLKELNYMRCPKCGMSLEEIEYSGFKADKCIQCEGIWLDVEPRHISY